MKKFILFLSPCLMVGVVHARQIVLDIPDDEIAIVETYTPDAEQWIKDDWAFNVKNSKAFIVKQEVQYSLDNEEAVPASQDAIVKQGMARMGSRKQRDAILADPNATPSPVTK